MTMDTAEPGIRLAVGISGTGKTHGIKQQIYRSACVMPVMVLDRMHEWNEVPPALAGRTVGCQTIAQAREHAKRGKRLIVVRPSDIIVASNEACAWARDWKGVAGVAIAEAHRVAPNVNSLPLAIDDVATAWRHHKVALWLDTQRFALLNRTLTEQARELRIYSVVGDRDLSVVSEIGGKALVASVMECAARLARNEPGWHVELGLVRTPPYDLKREG